MAKATRRERDRQGAAIHGGNVRVSLDWFVKLCHQHDKKWFIRSRKVRHQWIHVIIWSEQFVTFRQLIAKNWRFWQSCLSCRRFVLCHKSQKNKSDTKGVFCKFQFNHTSSMAHLGYGTVFSSLISCGTDHKGLCYNSKKENAVTRAFHWYVDVNVTIKVSFIHFSTPTKAASRVSNHPV